MLSLVADDDGYAATIEGAPAVWRRCPRRALRAALEAHLDAMAEELAEGREVRVEVRRRQR